MQSHRVHMGYLPSELNQGERMIRETGINIIVADDNPQITAVPAEILTEQGHTVRTTKDGNAVLLGFRDCVPDVLVTDLETPGLSGFDLIPLVRQRFSQVSIIAMSGAYTADNIPNCVISDEFYPKGADGIAQLLEILARVKNRHELDILQVIEGTRHQAL